MDRITRTVTVKRSLAPKEVLKATGRVLNIDPLVVEVMPRGEGDVVTVEFFYVDHMVNDEGLEEEYCRRNLQPVDPYTLAQANADDPAFADTYQNGTHWLDDSGEWCYLSCDSRIGRRRLFVARQGLVWGPGWFGGIQPLHSEA